VWGAFEIELPDDRVDDLIGSLPADCLGVRARSAARGLTRLVVYLPSIASARTAALGLPRWPELAVGQVERVPDGQWLERYQAALLPFRVGRRFLVDPAGTAAAPGGRRTLIRLVPGRAFGTGEHPTTRLCVAWLEREVRPGTDWADVGCGSGILAVVAAHCGARRVRALDDDPQAVEVAREVVAGNGLAERVDVREGGPERLEPAGYDGVVVNISAAFFRDGAGPIARALRPRGVALACGFPAAESATVARALAAAGLATRVASVREGWGSLVGRRPPTVPARGA
jgi:ribosomal protein L11 methyltransferase